jgi:FkbM family methyltransferase
MYRGYSQNMSLLRQAINEARFFRSHPAAGRSTFPRYAAWQVRSALNLSAVVPLDQYGLQFYCPADRRGTAKLVYIFRERCESELPVLSRFAGPGDSVIDIGAHFGIYTVALASLVGPAGSVLAIEAASRAFSMLGRNVALNDLKNVEAVQAAAADQEGTVSFFVSDDPARSSLVASGGSREEVRALRIDSLSIPRPVRFMKIDVEGAEPIALRGAADILHTDRPIIQFESTPSAGPAYGCAPDALWRMLTRECGYRVFAGENLTPVSELPPGIRNLYTVHPQGPQPRD